jgi:Zn finger protein HypA/HybF involved in hydrogenase expression
MVEDTSKSTLYSYIKFDKRYTVQVSENYHRVIPQWMDMVEKGTYRYHYTGRSGGYYGDASLWRQAGIFPQSAKPGSQIFPITKPSQTTKSDEKDNKVVDFPFVKIDDDEGEIPCMTCVFRSHKFFAEEADEDLEPDIYVCKQCENIFVSDTETVEAPICPICQTDEFMVLLGEDELPDNYIDVNDNSHLQKEPGIKDDTDYITCETCGNSFHRFSGETVCPFCYSLIDEGVDTEEERISQASSDAGDFLDAELNEANKAAIEETITKIPDPNEDQIPITEMPSKRDEKSILERFKRVFGGWQ